MRGPPERSAADHLLTADSLELVGTSRDGPRGRFRETPGQRRQAGRIGTTRNPLGLKGCQEVAGLGPINSPWLRTRRRTVVATVEVASPGWRASPSRNIGARWGNWQCRHLRSREWVSLTLPTGQGVRPVNALRRALHEHSENWVISLRPGNRGDGRRTGASGYGLPAFVGTDRSVLIFPGKPCAP